jgi:hypothetical protein
MEHMEDTASTGESGLPKEKKLDYKRIELFGKTGLSVEDMAAIMNISVERVQRLMGREKSKFFQCYRRGQALTRFNLLQRQIATALGDAKGNPALLTQLGSVILGQQPVAKKPLSEEQEESVEKLIQNVSSSDKTQMYNALIGNTEKDVGINDNEQ